MHAWSVPPGDADEAVHERVERLRARRQQRQVSLQGFSEAVEERPDGALPEHVMRGLTPFLDDLGQDRDWAHTDIDRTHHEIMSIAVVDSVAAVALDTLFLMLPFVLELPDGPLREHGQIAPDEAGVLTRQLHFPMEAEIIAHEHLGAGDQPGGEAFVVTIAQAEHEGVVVVAAPGFDLDQAEVTVAAVTEGVRLVDDFEVRSPERTLHLFDQAQVRDGRPRGGGDGRGNGFDGGALHGSATAMKDEIADFHDEVSGLKTTKAGSPCWRIRPSPAVN